MRAANPFARNRWIHLALLGGIGLAYVIASGLEGVRFRCPFASIGIECAGCGFTRAMIALCQLDIEQAYMANRAFVLIIQTIITSGWVYGSRLERKFPEVQYLAILLASFMCWRNIAP
jgi:hypothetical protein